MAGAHLGPFVQVGGLLRSQQKTLERVRLPPLLCVRVCVYVCVCVCFLTTYWPWPICICSFRVLILSLSLSLFFFLSFSLSLSLSFIFLSHARTHACTHTLQASLPDPATARIHVGWCLPRKPVLLPWLMVSLFFSLLALSHTRALGRQAPLKSALIDFNFSSNRSRNEVCTSMYVSFALPLLSRNGLPFTTPEVPNSRIEHTHTLMKR